MKVLWTMFCPKCHGNMELVRIVHSADSTKYVYKCTRCGHTLEVEHRYRIRKNKYGVPFTPRKYVDMKEWDL